jgi:hypothetical protein
MCKITYSFIRKRVTGGLARIVGAIVTRHRWKRELRRRSHRLDVSIASTDTNKLLRLAWLWPVSPQQQDGHEDEENKERVGYDIDDGAK